MSLTFYIVNAFTTDSFRGNPAAAVFIDDLQDTALMQNIAKNLNQPMTAFLHRDAADAQSADGPQTATFDVRWFTAQTEAPLCGHATIASSGLMFSVPGLIAPTVQSIVYRTMLGLVFLHHYVRMSFLYYMPLITTVRHTFHSFLSRYLYYVHIQHETHLQDKIKIAHTTRSSKPSCSDPGRGPHEGARRSDDARRAGRFGRRVGFLRGGGGAHGVGDVRRGRGGGEQSDGGQG